ncbi:MAG: glucosamine-6-phosphate deaminase [Planctomycetota bacterium]
MPQKSISVVRVADPAAAATLVADEIAQLAQEKRRGGSALVLGLATGRSTVAVYEALTERVLAGSLDLGAAIAFNLDEYCGLSAGDPRSFAAWMRERFFERVGWPRERTRIPSGLVGGADCEGHCAEYEDSIRAAGGLDLQLLGIGRNGHIGFNEPGSAQDSRTRRVRLAAETIEDAARDFGSAEDVPRSAITMGVATILDARRVRLLAFGENKRAALERALHGEISSDSPASFLREHPDLCIYADAAALGQSLPRKASV